MSSPGPSAPSTYGGNRIPSCFHVKGTYSTIQCQRGTYALSEWRGNLVFPSSEGPGWCVSPSTTVCIRHSGGDSMPSSTRPEVPGPSNVPQTSKRTMSDAESSPQDPKKARTNSSAESSTRRESTRDAKRRRRRRKKAPIVSSASKNEAAHSRPDEPSRAPLSARNEIIRFSSAPSEADLPALATKFSLQAPSPKSNQSGQGSSQTLDDMTEHNSQAMPSSTPVRIAQFTICHVAYRSNRMTRSRLFQ